MFHVFEGWCMLFVGEWWDSHLTKQLCLPVMHYTSENWSVQGRLDGICVIPASRQFKMSLIIRDYRYIVSVDHWSVPRIQRRFLRWQFLALEYWNDVSLFNTCKFDMVGLFCAVLGCCTETSWKQRLDNLVTCFI